MSYSWQRIFFHSKGLTRDMVIVFGVVTIAILVFIGYLFPGISSSSFFFLRTNLKFIIPIAVFIILLAFIKIAQIISPIIKISHEAKRIANGDLERTIKFVGDDEIGELGQALNQMTEHIKGNLEELKSFSQQTEVINTEINKRIVILTSLLQISNLVSQNTHLNEVIRLGVEKCLSSGEMNLGCLVLRDKKTTEFLIKIIQGSRARDLMGLENFVVKVGQGLLGKTILNQNIVLIDNDTPGSSDIEEFRKFFAVKNAIVVPLGASGKVHGLLIAANDKSNFSFPPSEGEFIKLLAKQISIALENDALVTRVEKLEIIDSLTGLYNASFIHDRLGEEIKRAISFQRPCAFLLLSIDSFKDYSNVFGHLAAENALIKIGSILKENIREIDKAARFGDHEFAVILPERNKRQAIEVGEEIRKKIEFIFSEEEDALKQLTCTGAVSENPVDGINADDLIKKAKSILESAGKHSKNKIYYKI